MWFKRVFQKKRLQYSGRLPRNLEKRIGYRFKNPAFLERALRHRSSLQMDNLSAGDSNELLEFLGDAVLGLVTADFLYRHFPDESEGKLTQLKSLVVSGQALSLLAVELGLGDFIIMGSGEIRNGGRQRPTILENAFEALVGAIYLDGGMKPAQRFLQNRLLSRLEEWTELEEFQNYKSLLLEWAQANNLPQPYYRVIEESGPDHNKVFTIDVALNEEILGVGKGRSKKLAEQRAARAAMEKIGLTQTP